MKSVTLNETHTNPSFSQYRALNRCQVQDANDNGDNLFKMLSNVFSESNRDGIQLGIFDCGILGRPCPRRDLGVMILAAYLSLPEGQRTFETFVIVRTHFLRVFQGVQCVGSLTASNRAKFLEAADAASNEITSSSIANVDGEHEDPRALC